MKVIEVDFNRLEGDVIPLGPEHRLIARGSGILREGDRVKVIEPEELEAIGTLFSEWSAAWGWRWWCARLDMSTLHVIDTPRNRAALAAIEEMKRHDKERSNGEGPTD